jgi:hypothetical protein
VDYLFEEFSGEFLAVQIGWLEERLNECIAEKRCDQVVEDDRALIIWRLNTFCWRDVLSP